jgi:flagellar biosynthesis GTPase FlhF
MRSRAIHCCSYVIVGLFVRPADALGSTSLTTQIGNQDVFSMLFESWRVLLAIGILAGLINLLARPKNREALGIEIPKQLIAYPMAFGLGTSALILVGLSLTSLPTLPLLVLAELFVLLAWTSYQKNKLNVEGLTPNEVKQQKRVHAVVRGSIMRLELGSSLLSLASPELNQNLVDQLASLRASVLDRYGITLPPIHIKDDLKLPSNAYRVYLRGGIVAEGIVYADRFMVIAEEQNDASLEGIQEHDPVFGLPVLWITEEVRDAVGKLFVQALDPVAVVMTHLSSIVDKHASELLTREEVSVMVNELRHTSPRVVDGAIGKTMTLSRFHKILQSLLEEGVSVKDLSTILETASDSATLDLEESVEQIRSILRRQICANVSTTGESGKQIIRCVEFPENVETAISHQRISKETIAEALQHAAIPLISEGLPIVIVSSNKSRRKLRAQVSGGQEEVVVLSRNEIVPEVELQIVGTVEPTVQTLSKPRITFPEGDRNHTISYAKSLLQQGSESSSFEKRIELGIAEIQTLVGAVLENGSVQQLSPLLTRAHGMLIKKGIDHTLAHDIVQHIEIDSSMSNDVLHQLMMQEMIRRLPRTVPPPNRDALEPIVIALVGPTGVGKTTTIAKLATKFRLQQGRSIALITADTYRVAAIDQLQQYANLFDSTLEIAGTSEQMKDAMEICKSVDIVLIDTAGRSAADYDRIQETADILQIANPNEVHLVLSAATSMSATKKVVEGFAPMRYDRIIVTKLDEVITPGEMVSTLCFIDKPMSWFTDGQDISAHLALARPSKLVESMWLSQRPITC